MTSDSGIRTDENGIPLLEDCIDPDDPGALSGDTPAPQADRLDALGAELEQLARQQIEQWLQPAIQQALSEVAPRLAQDLGERLRQALPALLQEATRRARADD